MPSFQATEPHSPTTTVADKAVTGRRLCAHADLDGQGMHWLNAGESCPLGGAIGPFEREHDARSLPAVRAAYEAAAESPRRGILAERNHKLLCTALAAAGVDLGAYDHRILLWMAGWEPQTCAVLAGLITRAAAGSCQPAGADDSGRLAAIRSVLAAFDWETDDRQLALEQIDRLAGDGAE